jgi:tRNA pseudouridine32 synthase / 23S rRNA pseudouridine746 synthase
MTRRPPRPPTPRPSTPGTAATKVAWPVSDPFPVLFRDPRFLVIDKPPGLPVHPGSSGGPSVESFFPLLSRRADGPWLAHRLDRDTSGCLLIALRKQALLAAQAAFAAGLVQKTYWAVVRGRPGADSGTVAMTMARQSDRQGWRMVEAPGGQESRTDWRVLDSDGRESWLELRLLTGRTHQARLHCVSLGCPILGDPVYGDATDGHMLHLMSRRLALPLAPPVVALAPPPAHIRARLDRHGWGKEARQELCP